jgi:hypothetical protein
MAKQEPTVNEVAARCLTGLADSKDCVVTKENREEWQRALSLLASITDSLNITGLENLIKLMEHVYGQCDKLSKE